jgi:hypothetical protein
MGPLIIQTKPTTIDEPRPKVQTQDLQDPASITSPSTMAVLDQQFLSHFISALAQPVIDKLKFGSWMHALPDFSSTPAESSNSIRAVTMMYCGTSTCNVSVQRKAHQWYIVALRQQRTRLERYMKLDTTATPTEGEIFSSLMLLYFELLFSSTHNVWTKHFEGLLALLKLRGPGACQKLGTLQILKAIKFLSVGDQATIMMMTRTPLYVCRS